MPFDWVIRVDGKSGSGVSRKYAEFSKPCGHVGRRQADRGWKTPHPRDSAPQIADPCSGRTKLMVCGRRSIRN